MYGFFSLSLLSLSIYTHVLLNLSYSLSLNSWILFSIYPSLHLLQRVYFIFCHYLNLRQSLNSWPDFKYLTLQKKIFEWEDKCETMRKISSLVLLCSLCIEVIWGGLLLKAETKKGIEENDHINQVYGLSISWISTLPW